MSAALYVVFEDQPTGMHAFVDGKALAQAAPVLQQVAVVAGVQPLMAFFGAGGEEYADLLEGADVEVPEAQWFEADEGLRTVRALLTGVEQSRSQLQNADAVVADLKAMERILVEAELKKVRWHLAVDF